MRTFVIGTVLLIFSSVLVLILKVLGVPNAVSLPVSITLACIGFALQLYAAFSMKRKFEQDMLRQQEEHFALMARVPTLSPEEAIRLLMRGK